jgi:hypothetical protein
LFIFPFALFISMQCRGRVCITTCLSLY